LKKLFRKIKQEQLSLKSKSITLKRVLNRKKEIIEQIKKLKITN